MIMMVTVRCQQVLIAESYGGRDEPVDTLINNFVGVGVEPVFEPVRVKEVPNEKAYQVCLTCCNHCYVLIYSVCTAQKAKCGKQNLVHVLCCSSDLSEQYCLAQKLSSQNVQCLGLDSFTRTQAVDQNKIVESQHLMASAAGQEAS